ncbi:MAG: CPBP family intramembrane metalloprotease [Lachnospiraceae bacterium]|nr:CPBP family intramembrane metalloprotease [Lachnospiraceae bacterium]
MKDTTKTKKQFMIFLLIAYGVTYVMGILTWYGSTIPVEMSIFPNAQMFYPAAGVMLAYLLTEWKDSLLPKGFYITFLLATLLMLSLAILSVAMPEQNLSFNGLSISVWAIIGQLVMIGGTILCWIMLLLSGKKRRAAYGLGWNHWKASILCIVVFLALYFGRATVAYAMEGQAGVMLQILQNPVAWSYLLLTPVNFLIAFAPFLGEEYGWRYFLQPLLQKRFGMRGGVLILGVAWGVWHIFLDFFYYTTPNQGLIMLVSQTITCVTLGIFFAWAYLKTNNIWVPVILHFLNNNLSVVVANNYSVEEVLENQQITWGMIPAALLLNGVLFGLFLLSKEFRD